MQNTLLPLLRNVQRRNLTFPSQRLYLTGQVAPTPSSNLMPMQMNESIKSSEKEVDNFMDQLFIKVN